LTGLSTESHKKSANSKGIASVDCKCATAQSDVLIPDEPTTGLDPNQLMEIKRN
jgi:ABC-type transporter Mla maintaining outer membrane lipid asymmetry ATPase subunit MlaF